MAKALAKESTALISEYPEILRRAMRLEFVLAITNEPKKLVLRVDALEWFDCHPNPLLALKQAREWIEARRPTLPAIESLPVDLPEDVPAPCKYQGCKRKDCTYSHSTYRCTKPLQRRGGLGFKPCGWYSIDSLLLPWMTESGYLLQVRAEPIRELLLIPNPSSGRNGSVHFNNEDLLKNTKFWQTVLDVCRMLSNKTKIINPIEVVALNFGTWETGQSLDHRALECHGHAHLILSRDAVESLLKLEEVSGIFKGRTGPSKDYLRNDIEKLESSRILSREVKSLSRDVEMLSSKVDSLDTKVNSLDTKVNSLDTKVDSLSSDVKSLSSKVNSLDTKVDSLSKNMDEKLDKIMKLLGGGTPPE